MTSRSCRTCRHFEPSPTWRRGWCRNTLLYAPNQSHLVDQDALDCNRGMGDFWEAAERADPAPSEATGQAAVKRLRTNPLRLFSPAQPRPATSPAGGTTMFARSRNDPDDADFGFGGGDDVPDDAPARSGRAPRNDLTTGRERTIHFQPEDRYWTDYLRIALPVIGLLLMLGLFWYWAAELIGDDRNEPLSTPPGQSQLINAPPPSPTATQDQAADQGQAADVSTADQTATADAQAAGEQPDAAQTPEEEQTGGDNQAADEEVADQQAGEIAIDAQVEVTEDGVRLRPEANTDQTELALLDQGTRLTVVDGPVEGDDFDWWQVQTEDGDTGWVAGTFLEPVGE